MDPQGISVPLLVTDFDLAIDFYCRLAGLFGLKGDVQFETHRNTSLGYKHPSHVLTVPLQYIEPEAWRQVRELLAAHSTSTFTLNLPVESCWSSFRAMTARGVVFESEPLDLPWGVQAKFRDPFGHRIVLFEDYYHMTA